MNRIGSFFGMMGMWVLVAVTGVITLSVGYWVSDVLYDAGIWPIGALLRITLLFELIGVVITLLILPFAAVGALIFGTDR